MKTFIALTALALTFTVGTALADNHGEGKGGKGDKGAKFAKADTNNDGFLTKNEMLQAHTKRIDAKFAKLDTNGDGKLSKDELKKGHKKMKDRIRKDLKN